MVSGVPQGYIHVLGPLLFLIYISDLSEATLSIGSKQITFADDILLYKAIKTSNDFIGVQSDIDIINSTVEGAHLIFSAQKCRYIIASKKCQPTRPRASICLGDIPLEEVSLHKYLGVQVSSSLQWSHHICMICTKARKLVGMLYRRFYTWADTDTLRTLYLTCIRPHLEYACQLWDPYLRKDIDRLENVQKFACKVCLGAWNLSYDEMLQKLCLPRLDSRCAYLKLNTMYNIVNDRIFYPQGFFSIRNYGNLRSQLVIRYVVPYARTNYRYYSFIPSVTRTWNSLPDYILSAHTVLAFKRLLSYHLLSN